VIDYESLIKDVEGASAALMEGMVALSPAFSRRAASPGTEKNASAALFFRFSVDSQKPLCYTTILFALTEKTSSETDGLSV